MATAATTASNFICQTFHRIKDDTVHVFNTYREPVVATIKKVVKIAIATLCALSMPSVFFFGLLYAYVDQNGSRALINRLTADWTKSSRPMKAAIIAFAAVAWPGCLALSSFLLGSHTAHIVQDFQPESVE